MARAGPTRPAASCRAASAKASWTVSCIAAADDWKGASTLGAQQFPDIVHEHVRALPVAHEHAQASLGIENERAGRVIHGVAARRRTGLLLIEDPEFLGDLSGLASTAVET